MPHSREFAAEGRRRGCVAKRQTQVFEPGARCKTGRQFGFKFLGVPHSREFAAEGRRRGCVARRQTQVFEPRARRKTGRQFGFKFLGVPHSREFAVEDRVRGCVAVRQTLPLRPEVWRTKIPLSILIKPVTTPLPQFRIRHQAPFHRILMHIVQLLDPLLLTPHVEIIKSSLPETPRPDPGPFHPKL